MTEIVEEAPVPLEHNFWKGVITKLGMISRHIPPIGNGESKGIYSGTYFANSDRRLKPEIFDICKRSGGSVVAAGGSVLSAVEHLNPHSYYNNEAGKTSENDFTASDLDLYIRANSAEEAQGVVQSLLEYASPYGIVVRSRYALSFYCEADKCIAPGWGLVALSVVHPNKDLIKVQIIDRFIPRTASPTDDINCLFETFDLDCCKWACDGYHYYTTERAIDAYRNRICYVPWQRISDSSINRMARYFERCYDFEIEGYDSRQVVFPQAVQKIAEIIRTRKPTPDLPMSNYSNVGGEDSAGGNPMFKMLKNYNKLGFMPYAICGTKDDAMHMVMKGTQPETYMFDWCLETLNKMAGTVLWLVSPNSEEDRERVRGYCITNIEGWKRITAESVSFPPMFSEPFKITSLSLEVYEKYWKPERAQTPCFVI
jgi:hypothetical protein